MSDKQRSHSLAYNSRQDTLCSFQSRCTQACTHKHQQPQRARSILSSQDTRSSHSRSTNCRPHTAHRRPGRTNTLPHTPKGRTHQTQALTITSARVRVDTDHTLCCSPCCTGIQLSDPSCTLCSSAVWRCRPDRKSLGYMQCRHSSLVPY